MRKYCLSKPLVFSLMPRLQGLCGLSRRAVGLSHFTPPIVGQGKTPLRVYAVEHSSKSSHCHSGSCMIRFYQCAEERASLNQRTGGGRTAYPLDQISLPMARHNAVFDFRRPHMDADHIRNGAAPICTPSARSPTLPSLEQAGDQLGTQLTPRHRESAV